MIGITRQDASLSRQQCTAPNARIKHFLTSFEISQTRFPSSFGSTPHIPSASHGYTFTSRARICPHEIRPSAAYRHVFRWHLQ